MNNPSISKNSTDIVRLSKAIKRVPDQWRDRWQESLEIEVDAAITLVGVVIDESKAGTLNDETAGLILNVLYNHPLNSASQIQRGELMAIAVASDRLGSASTALDRVDAWGEICESYDHLTNEDGPEGDQRPS